LNYRLGFLDMKWEKKYLLLKLSNSCVVCDGGRETQIIYLENVVCESIVWREGGDESEQTCLLTFGEISDRRMKELGSDSCIDIVVLDVS